MNSPDRRIGIERFTEKPLSEQRGILPPIIPYAADLFLDLNIVRKVAHILGLHSLAERGFFQFSFNVEPAQGTHIDLIQTKLAVYKTMLERDSEKYQLGICGLQVLHLFDPFIFEGEKRAEILERIYIAMRIVDDVMDDDAPNRFSPEEKLKYLNDRLAALASGYAQRDLPDPVDTFLARANDLAQSIGIDIRQIPIEIIEALRFDVLRIKNFQETNQFAIYPEEILNGHFYQLDVSGTSRGFLLTCGEKDSPELLKSTLSLGHASRIFYNLRDLQEDILRGLCNISQEDMERFDISSARLMEFRREIQETNTVGIELPLSRYPSGVLKWMKNEVTKGEKLLEEHKLKFQKSFEKKVVIMTNLVYFEPARKYFEMLQEQLNTL